MSPGRYHLDLSPTRVEVDGRRVTFVGAMFHSKSVMIEYDVMPPIVRDAAFGPCLLMLVVTDDTSTEVYPTMWEDFDWSVPRPGRAGRVTTRLERRPSAPATVLHVSVRTPDFTARHLPRPGPEIARFDVHLPRDHADRGPTPSR
jgi:hypothetical protein